MKTVAPSTPHISRYFLERVLCGELDLEQYPEQKCHLQDCEQCGEYLSQAQEQAAFLTDAYPSFERLHRAFGAIQPQGTIKSSMVAPVWRWLDAVWLKPALAAVLVCLVVTGIVLMPHKSDALAIKGDVSFSLYVNGALTEDDAAAVSCRPGDTLQLVLTAPAPVYYWILYCDDAAGVKVYMPQNPEDFQQIGSAAGARLPHAIVLDSAWREEQLYCVWSAKPRPQSQIVKFVKQAAADQIDGESTGGLRLQTFSLRSDAP